MNAEHIDAKSEQVREVFAYYGLAMYHAQCMERQLAMILATRYGPDPTEVTRIEFDKLLEDLFSQTLGQLVSDIRELSALNKDEESQLTSGLEKRNWLAHRFFWDRAEVFLSEHGRASMIDEIQDAMSHFVAVDRFLTAKTLQWGESFGITQQAVDRELDRRTGNRDI